MPSAPVRVAIVAWAALVVLAAWPWRDVPVLGPLSGFAERALARVSVVPGMAIFLHSQGDEKLHAHCLRAVGMRPDGRREVLYAPRCPPHGFEWGVDPLEVTMQRIVRGTPARRLLEGAPDDATRLRFLGVRRYAAIGDWFCRSPLAGAGDYASVSLTEQRVKVSYERGVYVVSDVLVCTWRCAQEPVPLPQCRLTPADDPGTAIVGPAAR